MQIDVGHIPTFREIHKSAWIKRIWHNNCYKLFPSGHKKPLIERWWTVFCIHGDIEPYLEGYTDSDEAARAHIPRWKVSLVHTLHVSGSVGPARPHTEYEFVITLQEGAIRLVAPTWESMQDWVDTLRSKLREMNILSPRENVYSKGPEQIKPRAPTRDPMSPLPAPPPGPIVRVPGTEPSPRPLSIISTNNICRCKYQSRPLSEHTYVNQDFNDNRVADEYSNIDRSSPGYANQEIILSLNLNSTPQEINEECNNSLPPEENSSTNSEIVNVTAQEDNLLNVNCDHSSSLSNQSKINNQAANVNHAYENSIVTVDGVELINDVDFIIENSSLNLSNLNDPSQIAGMASVSGMNICLVDSVLEQRMKTEADKDLFMKFDSNDDSQPSTSTGNKEVSAKYSKVCLKSKTKSDKTTTINIESQKLNNGSEKISATLLNGVGKSKPPVLPRTIFDNGNKGFSINSREIMDNHVLPVTGKAKKSKSPEANVHNKIISDKKPTVVEKAVLSPGTSGVNQQFLIKNNSPIPNAAEKEVLSNDGSSNVTIISVSNEINSNNASSSHNNSGDDIKVVENVRKPLKHNYVNVENNISIGGSLNIISNDKSNENVAVYRNTNELSSTSGYGHIKHNVTEGCNIENNHNTENIVTAANTITINANKNINTSTGSKTDINHSKNVQNPKIKSHKKLDSCISTVEISNTDNNQQPETIKNDDVYESVFTPFTVSATTVLPEKIRSHSDKNSSDYEFLSWNQRRVSQEEPSTSHSISHTAIRPEENETIDRSSTNTPANISLIEINDNNLDSEERSTTVLSNPKPEESDKLNPTAKITKHGLFNRGLTEFSIITKFKNIGHSNSSRSPLLKSSQFYEDVDPLQGTSSSTEMKTNLENMKKNNVFTEKLNHIFSKIGEDRINFSKDRLVGRLTDKNLRGDSSLRRNWSEHNDRTVLPVIKLSGSINIHRSRLRNDERSPSNASAVSNTTIIEERQIRRRSSSLSDSRSVSDNSTNSTEALRTSLSNINTAEDNAPVLLRPMGLREQQVARLRGEMAHAGGVRLRLRCNDCPGEAMALADVYGTVWICGWKQKTHPLLYNALHIGDRLATVRGELITSVRQAKRALKDTTSELKYVELVIKRLPHGRVYALKKNSDNEELGLLIDSATITGVIPGSPAAKVGVPSKGTITEVNGRPINLLLKKGDTQVRDRLNAIGREVSILVQPTEFVALLRTSLRNIRGHKDYIVQ